MRSRYGRRAPMRGARRRLNFRKKKVPVPKKRRTTRTYTRNNSRAINTLARDIKYLKMSQYGSIQRNFHTSNLMVPYANQPILTDIMNFSARTASDPGAKFVQYNNASPPVIGDVGNWTPSTNLFYSGQNVDIPDTGKYLALSCKVTLRFQATPSVTDQRIRIDLFSIKATAIQQNQAGTPFYSMPQGLLQLTDLANPEKNKLGSNPYLKVWATKWLYLSSSRNAGPAPGAGVQNPGPAVTGNSGYLSFFINPKNGKLRTQDITVPATPSDTATIPDGNWGAFNVPQSEPLFLLISSSVPNSPGVPPTNNVSVQCSRSVKWRDPIGKSSL